MSTFSLEIEKAPSSLALQNSVQLKEYNTVVQEGEHPDCFREVGPYDSIKQKCHCPVPRQQMGSLSEGLKYMHRMMSLGGLHSEAQGPA